MSTVDRTDIRTAPIIDETGGNRQTVRPFSADELAAVLADVEAALKQYVVLGDHEAVCLALWAAHTHVHEDFDTTPYIHVSSPEPACGKTRLLEVLEPMVRSHFAAAAATGPTLFRAIQERKPTVFVDEADQLFAGRADSERLGEITAVLNLGYRNGATVPRNVPVGKGSFVVQDFGVYCPKIIAGIRDIPGPLESRCIPIRMRRKLAHQGVARYRPSKQRGELEQLGDRLRAALVGLPDVEIPDEALQTLTDRQAECWEPLLILAKAAGGQWYNRAVGAAQAIHSAEGVVHLSPRERILGDIRDVWPADKPTLTSAELLDLLVEVEDAPWSDWFGKVVPIQVVSEYLKAYGLRRQRLGRSWKGWLRSDFQPVWARYLAPDTPAE